MSSLRRKPLFDPSPPSAASETVASRGTDPVPLLTTILTELLARPAPEPPRFLSVADTAAALGIDPMTLYRAIRNNQFPAVKVRGRYIIPASAIQGMADAAVASGSVVDVADWTVEGGALVNGEARR